jgi:Golgi nucleoside diphosphatase
VKPGLSTFAATPDGAGLGYMRPLLDFARAIVPAEQQRSAVLLLRATAGMRLVPAAAAQRIYDSLYEAVRTHGAFSPTRALFGTLSGEDEGVFGWLAVNQLLLQAHRSLTSLTLTPTPPPVLILALTRARALTLALL